MINVVHGNLLNATEQYIAHQCNCTSNTAAGIAYQIFKKFPHADIYSHRTEPDTPGDIIIKGDGKDARYIINLMGQYYPGAPDNIAYSFHIVDADHCASREKYFYKCLQKIVKIKGLESIAFPYRIGCGLAGGNWNHYLGNILNFEKYCFENLNVRTSIYCLTKDDYDDMKQDLLTF